MVMSFLTLGVKRPDEDDWGKDDEGDIAGRGEADARDRAEGCGREERSSFDVVSSEFFFER